MNQLFFDKGMPEIIQVPSPSISDNEILVKNFYSCFSRGTELDNLKKGKQSILNKVRSKPEKITKVLDYCKNNGLNPTLDFVKSQDVRLEPSGYSSAGQVISIGKNVVGIKPHDYVCLVGANYAYHAEHVKVPYSLAVKLKDSEFLPESSTVAILSIALQSVRQLNPVLGENYLIIGGGLLGIITAKLLELNGCFSTILDINRGQGYEKEIKGCELIAIEPGTEKEFLNNYNPIGYDGTIVTAASSSKDIIKTATYCTRKKRKIVITGVVPLELDRRPFYDKELEITISCSYGPGRYDSDYEENCKDYPIEYVRWTEGRNLKCLVDLIETQRLNISELINVVDFTDAKSVIKSNKFKKPITLFKYDKKDTTNVKSRNVNSKSNRILIIGLSQFALNFRIPSILNSGFPKSQIHVCSSRSESFALLEKRFGITNSETQPLKSIQEGKYKQVFLTYDKSKRLEVIEPALKCDVPIFVEKPVIQNLQECERLYEIIKKTEKPRMVFGFNRNHTKIYQYLKSTSRLFSGGGFVDISILNKKRWLGRENKSDNRDLLFDECCHFTNFICSLVDSPLIVFEKLSQTESSNSNFIIHMVWENKTKCLIKYRVNGNSQFNKENIEIHQGNESITIENFKKLKHFKNEKVIKKINQSLSDKGWDDETVSFTIKQKYSSKKELIAALEEAKYLLTCAV